MRLPLPPLPEHEPFMGLCYTAAQMRAYATAARAQALEEEAARWKAALSPVMNADFKDWHDNATAELPSIAAWVISNLRERLEEAEHASRQQALEDAANVCESQDQEYEPYTGQPKNLAYQCAAAIRAMKGTP